jgi:hypothetical protein
MTTRMISPDGGATHAYGAGDIARLEKLGWKVEVPITVPVINGDTDHPTPAEVIEEQKSEGDEHLAVLKTVQTTDFPPAKRKYVRKG